MRVNDIINKELIRLGRSTLDGIRYEQYTLKIGINKIDIYENTKFVRSTQTKQEAIELINTINSGT